ncbi:hypothetical protein [Acetobacter sp. LMG 32666]|uniref:hypothetical protein n=1 Tax=Acetobacter sp. LMG 32666 TaxID=2959295 RepID=UPI0030C8A7DA
MRDRNHSQHRATMCQKPVITVIDTFDNDGEWLSGPHDTFINLQKDYIRLTFDLLGDGLTAPVGAAAISDFLRMAN